MNRLCAPLLLAGFLISCTSPLSPHQIPRRVDELMGEPWLAPGVAPPRQDAFKTPNVALMKNAELWTLIHRADPSEHRVIVAVRDEGLSRGFFRGTALVSPEDTVRYKQALTESIPGLQVFLDDVPIRSTNGTLLPIFHASVKNLETLTALRRSPIVDYVEPAIIPMDSLACGFDPYTQSGDRRAFDSFLSNGEMIPYSYSHHAVQEAWGRFVFYKPGYNEGIAILDSGVSSDQEQFFSFYNLGDHSYGRRWSHIRLNETSEDINDICFHGTKVASVAAAPREGRSIVGIAWEAPLMTVKVVHSPLVTDNHSVGAICNGLTHAITSPLDGRGPTRVVAMALGLSYYSPTIAECITTAFNMAPSTLFVAAAGSNVTEVVFPANYKPFVIAVSMVEIDPDKPGYRLMGRPLTVAYGPEVDFVSVSTADGIPASGPVGNFDNDQIARFRYSSAATGVHAGLFAVAGQIATERGWDRAQLISVLRQSASRSQIHDFSGEPLELIAGAGIIDLYRASGGARKVTIYAPYQVSRGQQVELRAETDAVIPSGESAPAYFSYKWSLNGTQVGTTDKITLTAPDSGSLDVKVSVTDAVDHTILEAAQQIDVVGTVPSPAQRRLFWSSYVADWATFLNGGRHDRDINAGLSMPTGCAVLMVMGQRMDKKNGRFVPYEGKTPTVAEDDGNVGFRVSRPSGLNANDLEAWVHEWHDGLSIIRTKVVYDILEPAGVDCVVPGVLTTAP